MKDTIQGIPTLTDLRSQREEIIGLVERFGGSNVRIFGSVARGDGTPESDVDLLVEMKPGVNMFDLVGLWLELKNMLGHEVSLVTDDDHPRRERFMRGVRQEAIPL
jgi:predicted nucleotidyltransferase